MSVLISSWLYYAGLVVVFAVSCLYVYFRWHYTFWKKRGVPQPLEPAFPSGNFPGMSRTRSLDMILSDLYKETPKERLVGLYIMHRPVILVRDLELAKNILVKDFSHFHDRGFDIDTKYEPLSGHLFLMNGQEWRNLRIKLVPTFTSGKMKMMYPTLVEVGKELIKVLEKESENDETEVKEILSRFTTDVISSVAFGIESNSLKEPDNEFRKMGLLLAKPNLRQLILNMLVFAAPKLVQKLKIKFLPDNISDFFIGIVRDTMNYRETKNVQRNDFLQLLLQLKNLGYVKDADNPDQDSNKENQQKFTLEQAAAQAFLFFFAGFETSSSTMQFTLYELAIHPEIQEQVQDEVDAAKKNNGGEITYEALMKMELLDRIVDETLRKYPVAGALIRECTKEYPIPDSDINLQPKDQVMFSITGIHHDPEYYPDPEKFDPDRFLPENKANRLPFTYMPFGEGPRNCIGNRFGLMQTKAGLALVLSQFTFSPSKKTPIPMVFNPKSQILSPLGDMHLKITKRNIPVSS